MSAESKDHQAAVRSLPYAPVGEECESRVSDELVIWHEDEGTKEIPMNKLSSYERHTVEREADGRLHGGYPF